MQPVPKIWDEDLVIVIVIVIVVIRVFSYLLRAAAPSDVNSSFLTRA